MLTCANFTKMPSKAERQGVLPSRNGTGKKPGNRWTIRGWNRNLVDQEPHGAFVGTEYGEPRTAASLIRPGEKRHQLGQRPGTESNR